MRSTFWLSLLKLLFQSTIFLPWVKVDETFQISTETKPISHMAVAGGTIWLSLHNAAQLRCYNSSSREQLAEINITPQVTKMLHGKLKSVVLFDQTKP